MQTRYLIVKKEGVESAFIIHQSDFTDKDLLYIIDLEDMKSYDPKEDVWTQIS